MHPTSICSSIKKMIVNCTVSENKLTSVLQKTKLSII